MSCLPTPSLPGQRRQCRIRRSKRIRLRALRRRVPDPQGHCPRHPHALPAQISPRSLLVRHRRQRRTDGHRGRHSLRTRQAHGRHAPVPGCHQAQH